MGKATATSQVANLGRPATLRQVCARPELHGLKRPTPPRRGLSRVLLLASCWVTAPLLYQGLNKKNHTLPRKQASIPDMDRKVLP